MLDAVDEPWNFLSISARNGCWQYVDPPQCSLTAESANADNVRAIAKNMLVDPGWWSKRLRILAARDQAMAAIRQGLAA